MTQHRANPTPHFTAPLSPLGDGILLLPEIRCHGMPRHATPRHAPAAETRLMDVWGTNSSVVSEARVLLIRSYCTGSPDELINYGTDVGTREDMSVWECIGSLYNCMYFYYIVFLSPVY